MAAVGSVANDRVIPRRVRRCGARVPLRRFQLERETVARACTSLAEAGVLVVGEFHGVRETPGVLYSLASACKTRAVAFEWSHEEMNESVQDSVRSGSFDFDRLWALPTGAEFFSGDGRITAGHFALLKRLRDDGRLNQVIVFDRLDPAPEPPSVYSLVRDREMADRAVVPGSRPSSSVEHLG